MKNNFNKLTIWSSYSIITHIYRIKYIMNPINNYNGNIN